jgi:multidrug efflux pump subunit AcrA (membrane-fusion protein)
MTVATELPLPRGRIAPTDAVEAAATVAELRRQMSALEEQVAAINRQQAALRAALNQVLARFPDLGHAADAGAPCQPPLRQCAADVVRVLREVGRPLGTLEILEELATRHLGWRESTVRHVLADLVNEGIVREGQRPMSYSLTSP